MHQNVTSESVLVYAHTHTRARARARTHAHTHTPITRARVTTEDRLFKYARIKEILTSHNMREKLNEIQITYVIY